MQFISGKTGAHIALAMMALPLSAGVHAQQDAANTNIVVTAPVLTPGPEIKGVITARNENRIKVTAMDGTATVIDLGETTKFKTSGGGFSKKNPASSAALLNGMPVTVKTMQSEAGLVASQISFKSGDYKTAAMIRNATDQRFGEQTAATEALKGRMGDIDKYNVKATTNVYFDTGKAALSEQARAELCNAATAAEGTNNALLLVVGYTDSVGSDEFNQVLSEKRANSVINYLQQQCHWKPYRMLTPTGMAKADPLADNTTEEGKAQNRRVAVNVLVSKGLDGL
ncbi:OmpA family protein [Novosphingobium sp.]|uniref:OmpA family protein n=1 Tax=Novosphingobium sp. TaxID=1874826 RepID=UPI00286E1251|nr:OmpA family protein [Novosphingobium sp.]